MVTVSGLHSQPFHFWALEPQTSDLRSLCSLFSFGEKNLMTTVPFVVIRIQQDPSKNTLLEIPSFEIRVSYNYSFCSSLKHANITETGALGLVRAKKSQKRTWSK